MPHVQRKFVFPSNDAIDNDLQKLLQCCVQLIEIRPCCSRRECISQYSYNITTTGPAPFYANVAITPSSARVVYGTFPLALNTMVYVDTLTQNCMLCSRWYARVIHKVFAHAAA